jgi:hypothetical protein
LDLTTLILSVSRAGLVARAEALLITSIGWKLSGRIGLIEDFWTEVNKLLREKGVI